MDNVLLTIMTPTYNRAHTLPVAYVSLCNQSDSRFVWMIIDDGSVDNTEPLVHEWMQEGKIKILYQRKQNGGKASALNVGMEMLTTKYVACLDSDDSLFADAVRKCIDEMEAVDEEEDICGLLSLRCKADRSIMRGKDLPKGIKKATAADVFMKYNISSELFCVYKTSIIEKYRFPEFKGENQVSPAWMQYQITQEYYFALSQSRLCICEYQTDGLTRNIRKVTAKNPKGYTCVKLMSFELAPTVGQRIKNGIMYDCGCILGKDRNWLKNTKQKIWAVLLYPLGYIASKVLFADR